MATSNLKKSNAQWNAVRSRSSARISRGGFGNRADARIFSGRSFGTDGKLSGRAMRALREDA